MIFREGLKHRFSWEARFACFVAAAVILPMSPFVAASDTGKSERWRTIKSLRKRRRFNRSRRPAQSCRPRRGRRPATRRAVEPRADTVEPPSQSRPAAKSTGPKEPPSSFDLIQRQIQEAEKKRQEQLGKAPPSMSDRNAGIRNGPSRPRDEEQASLDLVLQAQRRVAEAQIEYVRAARLHLTGGDPTELEMDIVASARDEALKTWRRIRRKSNCEEQDSKDEAQARAQYFLFKSQVENRLAEWSKRRN